MELKNRSFLKLLDYTPAEIGQLLELAADLKAKKKAGIRHDQLREIDAKGTSHGRHREQHGRDEHRPPASQPVAQHARTEYAGDRAGQCTPHIPPLLQAVQPEADGRRRPGRLRRGILPQGAWTGSVTAGATKTAAGNGPIPQDDSIN